MPQNGVDPLSNGTACLRDAILMQKLGVNTIRVYNLDPTVNHDDCASIFNAAGIYMIIDVNSPLPNGAISAASPSSSYNGVYLKRIFQVVEAFKNYSNLLGFFGGNEIVNDMPSGKLDPPYIRAVTRDLKEYISKHATREIPVGYSAADVREILFDTWAYLQCAINGNNDDMSRIDFFGLNSYSWCGPTGSYQTSGYDTMVEDFANTTIPIFFSEYGCNAVQPRTFTEVGTIYGSQMRAVMSGGLVYEWTQETNDYGLVQLNDNNTVSLMSDYNYLQQQFDKLDFKAITSSNSTATSLKPPSCAAKLIGSSGFSTNFKIPNTPSQGASYITSGVTGAAGGQNPAVSDTAMPCTAYDQNGKEISGLTLKVESGSNTPTGSAAAASSSSAAIPLHEMGGMGVGLMGLLGSILML